MKEWILFLFSAVRQLIPTPTSLLIKMPVSWHSRKSSLKSEVMWHKHIMYYSNKISVDQPCTHVKLCGLRLTDCLKWGCQRGEMVWLRFPQSSTKERFSLLLLPYKGFSSLSVDATMNMFVYFCILRNVDYSILNWDQQTSNSTFRRVEYSWFWFGNSNESAWLSLSDT